MSRLVVCLRVIDRPIPYVASVAATCHTCKTPVWLATDCDTADGDEYICNACFPGCDAIKEAARASAAKGEAPSHAKLVDAFRAMAKSHGLLEPGPVAAGKRHGKGEN